MRAKDNPVERLKQLDIDIHLLEQAVHAYWQYASFTQDVRTDSLSGFVGILRNVKSSDE